MTFLAILSPFSFTMEWISLPSAAVFKRVKRGMARLILLMMTPGIQRRP